MSSLRKKDSPPRVRARCCATPCPPVLRPKDRYLERVAGSRERGVGPKVGVAREMRTDLSTEAKVEVLARLRRYYASAGPKYKRQLPDRAAGHLPAHDLATARIRDDGQAQPAFAGGQTGDVAGFLALPTPSEVWKQSKAFLEPNFVAHGGRVAARRPAMPTRE